MIAKTYDKKDYSGGLNSTASLREIAPNEATVLQNWDITYQGQLRQRAGLIKLGNTGLKPITGLGAYIRDSGADVLRSQGSNIEFLAGNTWQALLTTYAGTNPVWFENVQALNRIYITNPNNGLMYWDRASTTPGSALTVVGSSPPHGQKAVWFKNYMFHLNNVMVGSTLYPDTLFWSNIGDPDTYDTTNNKADIPGDGRLINAIPMGTSLVLFKERSIQYLTGYGNTDWQITGSLSSYDSLSEEVGSVSPRGATSVGDEVWFIDNQARIRRITRTDQDAFRHDVISKKIQASLDGINKAQLASAVAWSWNNKVYFAVPNGTDIVTSIVFVFDILASRRISQNPYFPEEAWTTYTGWKVSSVIAYPSNLTMDLYLGDAVVGNVYKHGGTDDNGVAIDSIFEDINSDFGAPDQYKNYLNGRITGEANTGNSNVYMDTSIDGLPYVNIGSLNLLTGGSRVGPTGDARCGPTGSAVCGGSVLNELRYVYNANSQYPLGKRVRHRIRHNDLGQQPAVNSFTSNFRARALR